MLPIFHFEEEKIKTTKKKHKKTKLQKLLKNRTLQLVLYAVIFGILGIVAWIYLKPEQKIPDISGIPDDFWDDFLEYTIVQSPKEPWPVGPPFTQEYPGEACLTCKTIACNLGNDPITGSSSAGVAKTDWRYAPRQALTTLGEKTTQKIYSEQKQKKVNAIEHESPFANLTNYLKGFNLEYELETNNPFEIALSENNYATAYGCMGPMKNDQINQWTYEEGPYIKDGFEDIGLTPEVEKNYNILKVSRGAQEDPDVPLTRFNNGDAANSISDWYKLYRTDDIEVKKTAVAKYPDIPDSLKNNEKALQEGVGQITSNTQKYWPQAMKSITFSKKPGAQPVTGVYSENKAYKFGPSNISCYPQRSYKWASKGGRDGNNGQPEKIYGIKSDINPQISNLDVDIKTTCVPIPMNTSQKNNQHNACIIVPMSWSRKFNDSEKELNPDLDSKSTEFGKNTRNYGSNEDGDITQYDEEGKLACPAGYVMTSLNLNPMPNPSVSFKESSNHSGSVNGIVPIDGASSSYPGGEVTSITCCPSNCLKKGQNNELEMGDTYTDGTWSQGIGSYNSTNRGQGGTLLSSGKTINDWNSTTFSCPEGPYFMTGIWFKHHKNLQTSYNGELAINEGIDQVPEYLQGGRKSSKSKGGTAGNYYLKTGDDWKTSGFYDDLDRRSVRTNADCDCHYGNKSLTGDYDVEDNQLGSGRYKQPADSECQQEMEKSLIARLKNPHARWKRPGAEAISIRCTPYYDNSCENCSPTAKGMGYCNDPNCYFDGSGNPTDVAFLPQRCCFDITTQGCDSALDGNRYCENKS